MRLSYNDGESKAFSKKVEDIIRLPVVIRVGDFDEAAAKDFDIKMSEAHETGQTIIPVVIDSYGGDAYALLSMIDTVKQSDLPVAMICKGKAMSCGAIFLTCGAEGMRYASENSTIMIHEVSCSMRGKNEELKANSEEADRLNNMVFEMMSRNIGKSSNYLHDIYRKDKVRADWYMNAQEAKRHNIVNEIGIPNLEIDLQVSYKLS